MFLLRLPDYFSPEAALSTNQHVVAKLMEGLPVPYQSNEEGVYQPLWASNDRGEVYIANSLVMQVVRAPAKNIISMNLSSRCLNPNILMLLLTCER